MVLPVNDSGSNPSPSVAWACGSKSMSNVEWPARASPAARLTAVVVLPTPPFWLMRAMVFMREPPAVRPCSRRRCQTAAD